MCKKRKRREADRSKASRPEIRAPLLERSSVSFISSKSPRARSFSIASSTPWTSGINVRHDPDDILRARERSNWIAEITVKYYIEPIKVATMG